MKNINQELKERDELLLEAEKYLTQLHKDEGYIILGVTYAMPLGKECIDLHLSLHKEGSKYDMGCYVMVMPRVPSLLEVMKRLHSYHRAIEEYSEDVAIAIGVFTHDQVYEDPIRSQSFDVFPYKL